MATYTPNLNLKKPASSDAADIADINGNMDLIDAFAAALLNKTYPVGSIYMSVNSTSPATLFGGTWAAIEGRFLLAAGGDYSAGDIGGEAEHTLTEAELPVMHKTMVFRKFYTENFANYYNVHIATGSEGTTNEDISANVSGPRVSSAINEQKAQKVSINIGGGEAHNNMPPYLAVYVWKRTA